MYRSALIAALLIFPFAAFAAGFASQAIFLSRSPVTEGSTVQIYAVVDNESSVSFKGDVVMNDGSQKLGSVPVSMDAGGVQTVSISWTPTAGKHTVSAELVGSDGTVAQTQSAVFSIDALPKPMPTSTPQSAGAVESSANLQQDIAQYSPQAAQYSKPVFGALDSFRSSAAGFLNGQILGAQTHLSQKSTDMAAGGYSVPNTAGAFSTALWNIYLYLLKALLFIVGNIAVFYPLFVIAVFYLLYKGYKWSRRPSY